MGDFFEFADLPGSEFWQRLLRDAQSDWLRITANLRTLSDEQLSIRLRHLVPSPLKEGHAYAEHEVAEIWSKLGGDALVVLRRFQGVGDINILEVRRETDLFAVVMGTLRLSEPRNSAQSRVRIMNRTVEAADTLIEFLADPDLRREVRSSENNLSLSEIRALRFKLQSISKTLSANAKTVEAGSSQGRRAEQTLKGHAIRLSHSFCRYLRPGFHAKRGTNAEGGESGKLLEVANILGRPWFGAVPRLEHGVRGFIGTDARAIENGAYDARLIEPIYREAIPEDYAVNETD